MSNLQLTNSLTRKKEIFKPINPNKVSLYACGPTVYDKPHVGNARSLVVFDVLYRVLKAIYGPDVIYVRNITDIDDKIIEASHKNKKSIDQITFEVTKIFHENCKNLNCLKPTFEPKATEHVKEMIEMTSSLISKGFAYEIKKHVYFAVNSFNNYGKLSNKNLEEYKEETSNEFYGALGYLTEINFIKENKLIQHLLKPKLLLRYSPGSMRKDNDGSRLNPVSAFNLNRVDNIYNFENGLNATVGLDYNIKKNDTELDFSVAQIINEKENKKMSSTTSLDEKLSDLVGSANLKLNDKIKLNYDFSLDQNYNNLNYNEIGTTINLGPINFGFDYLEERKHIGNKNYFKSKIEYNNNENRVLSFETKRNLITDSAEFYNLSYEYLNDCLRAGLVYRREFYNDSELEPENSLMFKITLTPFGNINSPSIDQ